ncbi:MAG: CBS domain-containing protein [Jatrophihabitans sp.]|nr:MAG: CBS domain-containing protein [Jatrophihabitans sp.]
MRISDILREKPAHSGSDVVTLPPDGLVRELLAALADQKIGAVVVVDGDEVRGIVSERDIVRNLHTRGADVVDLEIREIMTSQLFTCSPDDDLDGVATTMTQRRIRHMPVLADGRLVGLVSIGDVVSSRMRQLERDRGQLEQYISG